MVVIMGCLSMQKRPIQRGMTFESTRNPKTWRVLQQPCFWTSFLLTPQVKNKTEQQQLHGSYFSKKEAKNTPWGCIKSVFSPAVCCAESF